MLCGAADSFLPFVQELRRLSDVSVIIVYHTAEFEDYASLMEIKNVSFVEGSSTDKASLDEAGIHNAR